jgi:hypothetical protein
MLEKNDSSSPDICLIHGSNGLSEEEDFLKVTPRTLQENRNLMAAKGPQKLTKTVSKY